MARESFEIHFHRWGEQNVQSVLVLPDKLGNLRGALDDSFSQKEASRQFFIVPRCAHGHSDALSAQSDFQRLLFRQLIPSPARASSARHADYFHWSELNWKIVRHATIEAFRFGLSRCNREPHQASQ